MKPHLPAALLLTTLAGSTQSLALDLACLNKTQALTGFVIDGINAGDQCGRSVSCAGDINADGFDDILIGAESADPEGTNGAGECYIVFGGVNVGSSGSIELSTLDGTNGFVLRGVDTNDSTGVSVSHAGDINADGVEDIIVGADRADPNGQSDAGKSFVLFGGEDMGATGIVELTSLDGTNGFVLNGIDSGDQSGFSVSDAGDINGDGIDDLIIGAHRAYPNGNGYSGLRLAGESYVLFGGVNIGVSGEVELSDLDGINGFVLNGVDVDDESGVSVSRAGDVNADGVDDIIIGASEADPVGSAGESYVIFGGAGIGASGVFELGVLDGTNGFVVWGDNAGDRSGRSVSSAGDVNGDGVDDIIIGAASADPYDLLSAGESYVIFGGTEIGTFGSIELPPHGPNGFVLRGIDAGDLSGFSISSAGDVNGDGTDDIIIGAYFADPNGNSLAGESYVVFGGLSVGASGTIELSSLNGTNGLVLNGIDSGDRSGRSVSSAGDINGDGIDDIMIGAPGAVLNGKGNTGETYVIFGSPTLGQTIPQDLTANGCVDSADLAQLLAAWSTPDADLNSDGTTNSADLAILLAAWTG